MSGSLRMRVFAGPNGSGKSTMYRQVASTKVKGRNIDLGVYLNPDDIARSLRTQKTFDFHMFDVRASKNLLRRFAIRSGLINRHFPLAKYHQAIWIGSTIRLRSDRYIDRFAQLITQYLCHELIATGRKFSFETVFSHESKLELMRKAKTAGYKVYLYFIATEDPEINKDRVKTRVEQGGHDVPPALIEKRYHRSLAQLKEAIDLSYHTFLFDNTGDEPLVFAEYKSASRGVDWKLGKRPWPSWFMTHYVNKVAQDPMMGLLWRM